MLKTIGLPSDVIAVRSCPNCSPLVTASGPKLTRIKEIIISA